MNSPNVREHIKIAVDIPTTDKDTRLVIEPGTEGVVILSDGQFRVGVNEQDLKDALFNLEWMKTKHSIPKKEVKPEPAIGEIIEGDDDIPF